MGILQKITEFLIKKQWAVFLLSLILGFFGFRLVPNSFIESLPFSSRDVNVALCYVAIIIISYLVLSLILFIVKKIITCIKKKKENERRSTKEEAIEQKRREKERTEYDKHIEDFKTFIDSLPDYDYSVIMYLLNTQNKKPYIEIIPPEGFSIIYKSDYFYQTHEEVPRSISNIPKGVLLVGSLTETVSKYLMKEDFYSLCKTVIEATGSLSHFERKTIDLHQEG